MCRDIQRDGTIENSELSEPTAGRMHLQIQTESIAFRAQKKFVRSTKIKFRPVLFFSFCETAILFLYN